MQRPFVRRRDRNDENDENDGAYLAPRAFRPPLGLQSAATELPHLSSPTFSAAASAAASAAVTGCVPAGAAAEQPSDEHALAAAASAAVREGVPCCIVRLGNVVGDRESGACNLPNRAVRERRVQPAEQC